MPRLSHMWHNVVTTLLQPYYNLGNGSIGDGLSEVDSSHTLSPSHVDTRTAMISSTTRVCYYCGLKNFKDLAYKFREDIPTEEIPGEMVHTLFYQSVHPTAEVQSRPSCYYGNECRTQKHNDSHARSAKAKSSYRN